MTNDRFENFLNFNEEKRKQLVLSYNNFLGSAIELGEDPIEQFNAHIFSLKKTTFIELKNENHLIDTTIQFSLLYLEEYNYDLKSKGLAILEHLVTEATASQLNFNLRSKLIYDCLERYINDKDNLDFMDKTQMVMCSLLNVMESNQSAKIHSFKQHSIVFGALLNNSYMTTKLSAKLIYYKNFLVYMHQIGIYSCRHLDKILTVAFDCVDNTQMNLNFEEQENLLLRSLEIIECTIDICSLRIHVHAKRIINFLIRLLYLSSYTAETNSEFARRITGLINVLFKNKMAKKMCYQEFTQLKKESDLNAQFLKFIENI